MVKSYCVKQKKQTECVEPSGYKQAKNGRLMFFCTCAECGITKTKFVKSQSTGGAISRNTKPYCGIGKIPAGKHSGGVGECFDIGQLRQWGLNKVDEKIIKTLMKDKEGLKKLKLADKKRKKGN